MKHYIQPGNTILFSAMNITIFQITSLGALSQNFTSKSKLSKKSRYSWWCPVTHVTTFLTSCLPLGRTGGPEVEGMGGAGAHSPKYPNIWFEMLVQEYTPKIIIFLVNSEAPE